MARFIEYGEKPTAYDSILVSPEKLSIFGSELSIKIVKELAKQPACAMDLARRLEQHEQKIYYHLRNLEKSGIIRQLRTEQRYGMTAKIYDVVSPVVATKLYNEGYPLEEEKCHAKDPKITKFLHPFVKNGKLNSKIILGSPYPHGRFEATARDGVHAADFMLFLGMYVNNFDNSSYKTDTEIRETDLKDNLILIGGPKINIVVDRLNSSLPVYFDESKEWTIVSKLSGKKYNYDDIAVVLRMKNPFNKKKEILILAGKKSRGLRSAVLAVTRHLDEVMKGNVNDKNVIAKIIEGTDKDGDNIIDSIRFLE